MTDETVTPSSSQIDGVKLAIMSSRMDGIVTRMTNTLLRTARSGVLAVAKDFSCCLLAANGDLLAMAEAEPIHVLNSDLLGKALNELQPDLRPGDAYLNNSPYHGNTHAADWSVLVPVFDDDGVHRCTAVVKGHQADCGDSLPTTYHSAAKDVYEEGALIFPCVKVQSDYKDVEDIVRMCRLRIRVPDQWWGDYLALIGAARIGEREMMEFGRDVGWDVIDSFIGQWFDYSEKVMIEAVKGLSGGRTTARGWHDPVPGVEELPVNVTVEVDPENAMIDVDLRDNMDCQPFGLNLSEACSRGAALAGVFCGICADIPFNGGSLRRVRVHLRENCIVGIPRHPFSCSASTTNLADRVANTVMRAMADLGDGMGRAEYGLVIPASCGVISGNDPRSGGAPFVDEVFLHGLTGGAATPYADGWLTATDAVTLGMGLLDSAEIDEIAFPIRVLEQRHIPDSEGPGKFCGAPGAMTVMEAVDTPIEIWYGSDGSVHPAQGAAGGGAGGRAEAWRRLRTGEIVEAPAHGLVKLEPGEAIVSKCCGGGGYGPPLERDVTRVLHDVREGRVTVERARDVYGVAVVDGEIDEEATARLRGGGRHG
ncbi:MAG TPA: hydantoinase B/oxoprolinase family protein [Thermoleophilia bacterium]|nr:hydantoinase B/oxoprolinase family protein [Thermoleophilia bacterium]